MQKLGVEEAEKRSALMSLVNNATFSKPKSSVQHTYVIYHGVLQKHTRAYYEKFRRPRTHILQGYERSFGHFVYISGCMTLVQVRSFPCIVHSRNT